MKPTILGIDFDKMEAGPSLDLLIAEKVMKYLIIDITPPCDHVNLPYVPHIAKFSDSPLNFHFHNPLNNPEKNYNWGMFQPSTNILDSMKVAEKIGGTFQLEKLRSTTTEEEEVSYEYSVYLNFSIGYYPAFAKAETLSLAICFASLKAVME